MLVDSVSSKYLQRSRNSLTMDSSRKPFEVKKEKGKKKKKERKRAITTYLYSTIFFLG